MVAPRGRCPLRVKACPRGRVGPDHLALNFGNRGQAFIPDSPAVVAHVQPELSIPCPTCGGDLTFLDQYQRQFCYACQQYAPEGYGARGANKCPTCTGILSYVPVYDRFFCYRCQQYAGLEAIGPQAPTPRGAPPSGAAGTTRATRS